VCFGYRVRDMRNGMLCVPSWVEVVGVHDS
jgi:hypothetical protein